MPVDARPRLLFVGGGPLEAETWVRGQTIYLPDGRIPLHPAVLSEDAVSLFPDVDRAAVVWTIDVDAGGPTAGPPFVRDQQDLPG